MPFLLFLLAALVAAPALAVERSGPNPGNLAPAGAANASLFTGAFTYTYPIAVPPGRNGMQPDLHLTYNSQAGNGWLGIGWDLSVGSIQRSTRKGAPTYIDSQDTFIFNLSGQSQELVSIGTGSDGFGTYTEYRSQIEAAFIRFRYYSDKTWRAWTKDGHRHDFTGLALHAASGQYFYWGLTREVDTQGNYMEIIYPPVAGGGSSVSAAPVFGATALAPSGGAGGTVSYLPTSIRYAGHEGTNLAPSYEIVFGYENRPDSISVFRSGIEQKMTQRLVSITVRREATLIRRFKLSYTQSVAGSSLLQSVQMKGGPDRIVLPPETFSYSQPVLGFGSEELWGIEGSADKWDYSRFDKITAPTGGIQIPETVSLFPPSVAMLDINGDGFPDHVGKNSSENFFRLRLNSGSSYGPEQQWSVSGNIDSWSLARPSEGDNGIYAMLDMNGDGLPDHVKKRSYENFFSVRLNTGNGFGPEQHWGVTDGIDKWNLFRTDEGQSTVAMFDINGDGLPDHVSKSRGEAFFRVRLNTGSSFASEAQWKVDGGNDFLDLGYTGSNKTTVSMMDINGDGLPDHVEFGPMFVFHVWPNNGSGFGPEQLWEFVGEGSRDDFISIGYFDQGQTLTEMLDVNGDGLPDLLFFVPGYRGLLPIGGTKGLNLQNSFRVRLNTGNGFGPEQEWKIIGGSDNFSLGYTDGVRIVSSMVDIDGDGMPDQVEKKDYENVFRVRRNLTSGGDLLQKISNPLGGSIQVSYFLQRSSSALPFAVTTLQSLSTYDGMGSSVTVNFAFSGGQFKKSPWDKKEFLGFRTAMVTDAVGNKSVTTFRQNDGAVDGINLFKGQVEKVETFDKANNPLMKTVNTFSYTQPHTGVYFPIIARTDTYQLYSVGSKQTAVEYAYDDYGNVTQAHNLGDVTDSADDQTTLTDYAYNTGAYLAGFPGRVRLQDSLGTTISQSWTFYDNATDWGTPPVKGNATQSTSWVSGGSDPVVTRVFDVFGNVTDQYDALWNATGGIQGNHVQTTYDATQHQFPVQTSNALGHTESSTFDPGTGQVLTHTDPNQQTTTYQYDVFGRPSKVFNSLDSAAFPTTEYHYFINASPPHSVVTKARIEHGVEGTLDTYSFLDGLGRTVQTKTPMPQGKQMVEGMVRYNNRGLVDRRYMPYVASATAALESLPTVPTFATLSYDALGRVTQLTNPDGTTAQTSYSNWSETVTDPNGHRKVYNRDAYGRILRVDELINGQTQSTVYQYDPLGNLKQITNAQGQVTIVAYDSLSRKTALDDPQMGRWTYAYDINGNLTTQIDASLQVSTMTYDRLGRLSQKQTIDGNLTYTYDAGINGIGRLSQVADLNGMSHQYTYDALGQLTVKSRTVDGATYNSTTDYDALGRDKTLVYPAGFSVKNVYDGGATTRVDKGDGSFTYATMAYDTAGTGKLKTLTLGNGAVTTYAYNAATQRLSSLLTTAGGQTIQNLSYGFDNGGNITRITDAGPGGQNQTFTYDALDRLVQAVGGYGTKNYAYDAVGNLLSSPDNPQVAWDGESMTGLTTESGTPQSVGNGRVGNGLYFDGNSRSKITGSESLTLGTALTVSASVRPSALGSYPIWKDGSFGFIFQGNGDIQGSLTTSGSGTITLTATGTAKVGIWHAVALTYDGITAKLFVNGALKAQQAASGTVQGAGNGIVLGGFGFKGILDEFCLTPRALSAGEVQEQYATLPNLAPYQPVTPQPTDGRTIGATGTVYAFQFLSWDLDGDQIKYRIDWGDGTSLQDTPVGVAGVMVTATHSWTTSGVFNVKAQAVKVINSQETASAWSPTYVFSVAGTTGAKLEGFLLIGASGNGASSATKRATMTVGESVVSQASSAHYGITLGYQGTLTAPSPSTPLTLGPTGPGGQETLPPGRPSMSATLALTGSTSQEVNQIAQSLRQNPSAQLRDANGNYRISNGKWIKFDANNRPVRIVTSDGTKTDVAYTYDGQRVKKTVTPPSGPAVTTIYLGDIEEITSGQVTDHIFAGGQRIASKTGATVLYFHQDHLGSTSLITNSAGAVVQTTKYLPFGATWSTSGSLTDINFTGHRIDFSDGLIYARARYYDPAMGRFITPDTVIASPFNPQSLNRYAYCDNNPINYTDPTGNFKFKNFFKKFTKIADPFVWLTTTGQGRRWWNKNRNYVASTVLIAATVVATAYCGGCGLMSGALTGELVGGYSAYRMGGNVFAGVAVGGVVGGIAGFAGGEAGVYVRNSLEESQFGYVLGGAARGAILGAGSGAVAGYAGGEGDWNSIFRGFYRGGAIGGVAGGAFGYYEYSPGPGLSDISPSGYLDRTREAISELGKKAIQNGQHNLTFLDFAKAIGQKFFVPAVNSLAANPEIGYSLIYIGVGVEETDHYHPSNISVGKKFSF